MKASEDFLFVVLHSYTVVAAKSCINSDDAEVSCKTVVNLVVNLVVKNYV